MPRSLPALFISLTSCNLVALTLLLLLLLLRPPTADPRGRMGGRSPHGLTLRLDLRCVKCVLARVCLCVCEGEKKRPIREQRGQVCRYCFSSSPWKPWPASELMLNNELHLCVCECVCKYMKGYGQTKMSGALFTLRVLEFRDIRGEILKNGEGRTNSMTTGDRNHVSSNKRANAVTS